MAKAEVLATRGAAIEKAEVVQVTPSGSVIVVSEAGSRSVECDLLAAPGGRSGAPAIGSHVLAWFPPSTHERGVILGVVGPTEAAEPADELVIEAGRRLTLKVGDGSITIREDGKILIKGTHLVSHARKMNRIRGGSVAIN